MRIAIIGAGMAGLACAARLRAAGLTPALFDKGRGPAGRMASRRLLTPLGEAALDMGAAYFTVRSGEFAAQVAQWADAGLAAPWPEAGAHAWVGVPLMSSPLAAMAAGQNISWNALVGGLSRDRNGWHLHVQDEQQGPFDAVVIALPAEQATPLLALNDLAFMKHSARAVSEPCWTALFAFDHPSASAIPVFRNEGPFAWAAANLKKPGRTGPEAWVAHATAHWSKARLEAAPQAILDELLVALAALAGLRQNGLIGAQAHRWRFAKSSGLGLGSLWNQDTGLGVCGDWLLAPRVEGAWLSGFQLAQKITDRGSLSPVGPADAAFAPADHAAGNLMIGP